MEYRVLRPFPYSPDGIRIERLEAGMARPIRPELVAGLVGEGFIEPAAPPQAAQDGAQHEQQEAPPARRGRAGASRR